MTLLLHILAALLWAVAILLFVGAGYRAGESRGRKLAGLFSIILAMLIGSIAFTLQVMA
ncbi:hypothetical protein [Oceanicola sp. S124]|uniref:hypothetical protein n=1 Tax=Oceanicola sp. S124 TaxID=1042378 RepID=UPI0002E53DD5|nr:hypothetical protein [Oceanicola sp. S124]